MILVIDDNKDLADIFCEYFTMIGYEATATYTGEDGIAKAKKKKPKVILCDIGMAGMDGYEVAKSIGQDTSLEGVYMIAISGYSSQKDVEHSIKAGFNKHLSKPVDLEKIKKLIDDIIN